MNESYQVEAMNFNDYVELFFSNHGDKSDDTKRMYYNSISMMCKDIFNKDVDELRRRDLEVVTHEVLQKYKLKLAEKNTNTTVNARISTIKTFIRFMASVDMIRYDISQLDLVVTLSDDSEITEMIPKETFYEYVNYFEESEKEKGLEKKLACILMLESGNRAEEVLSVKKNQFTRDGDTYVLKSKGGNKGKGNKDYFERIGVELYEQLITLNPESEKIFSISYKSLLGAFNRANEHFGNTTIKYTPHSIKHLAVTLEYYYTGCILQAQRKGKHSSIETTRRYLRITTDIPVGAHTRETMIKEDAYKNADLRTLRKVIKGLSKEMQDIINMKLITEDY